MLVRSSSRLFFVLALLGALLASAGCRQAPSQPNQESGNGGDEAEPSEELEPTPEPRVQVAPDIEIILDEALDPYLHNPVNWRYRSVRTEDGEPVSDFELGLTTTAERLNDPEVGTAFVVVVETQGAGPISERTGEEIPHHYSSRLALLSPAGLTMSAPDQDISGPDQRQAVWQQLAAENPTWPLPGAAGCEGSLRNLRTAIGELSAIVTTCPSYATDFGPARVTTAWADGVGFVYRSIEVNETPLGLYEYLVGGDVVSLAPPLSPGQQVSAQLPPE
ncbi:MAG: hypothetical protein KC561_15970 [Myxococcales bacterium]|nr:hypothetical protein [Myxococcales bacterium]